MKVPLRFQVTEFDCGTVALLNAFSYLFERIDIPAELVRSIHSYTLDCYGKDGNLGSGGTSREAINQLTHWITRYSEIKDFNVTCKRLEKDEVTLEQMKECIKNKGVIFARCWQSCEHYIIITNIDDKYAYIFDSYYLEEDYYDKEKEVKMIFDKPFSYNRIVPLTRLFSETKLDFALGDKSMRECVLINKKLISNN